MERKKKKKENNCQSIRHPIISVSCSGCLCNIQYSEVRTVNVIFHFWLHFHISKTSYNKCTLSHLELLLDSDWSDKCKICIAFFFFFLNLSTLDPKWLNIHNKTLPQYMVMVLYLIFKGSKYKIDFLMCPSQG